MDSHFVVNVADARTFFSPHSSVFVEFEPADRDQRFGETGVNITVLQPGKPNGMYHAESTQEDFLVLHGECLLIVEDEEIRLKAWDFFHCPAGVNHIFVGLDEPCAVLMVGSRREGATIHYPVNEVAAKHGASVTADTPDPDVAYADWTEPDEPVSLDWPLSSG